MLFFGADNFLRESIPVNLFLNRILLYQVVNYQKILPVYQCKSRIIDFPKNLTSLNINMPTVINLDGKGKMFNSLAY
jgi:hypothetical protein